MLTQLFNIVDEMPGSVVCGVGIRARLTTASLVEQNYSVFRGVEEDGVSFGAVPTRPAMEVDDCKALAVREIGQDA